MSDHNGNGNGTNGNGHVENHGDKHGLIPQPHGGALRNGGTNKGGTGRPPSEIRAKLRGSFEQRISVLEGIADDPKASMSDRMKAVDLLAKYGLGTTVTETDSDGKDVIRVIREPRRLAGID